MRKIVLCTLLVAAFCGCTKNAPQAQGQAEPRAQEQSGKARFVILGFDGVDPRRVDALVAAGKLPHLAALRTSGYLGPLQSTNPPQSPVAWATFATGMAPGEHGIFDFVGRSPRTYFPEIATTRVRHAEVHDGEVTPAEAENLRHGSAFWDVIAKSGVPTRALWVPYNYPLPADGATAFAGLGVPDARGINSSFTLLTTDKERAVGPPPAGGQLALLEKIDASAWRAMLEGPAIGVDGKKQKTFSQILVRKDGERLQIELGGKKQSLAVGETGTYVPVQFVPVPSLTIKGVTRLTVRRGAPTPEIYVEPVSMTPEEPYLGLANPKAFGQELWRRFGPFKTVGWIDDTSALGAGAMDEAQFLREAFGTMQLQERILQAALAEGKDRVLITVFTAPDRIGHMFYRFWDKAHPAHPQDSDPAFVRALDDSYVRMDQIVGQVQAHLSPKDTLLVMSDHGFTSFRRGLNLNRWLIDHGYMTLKRGVAKPRDFFLDVDWSRTKAYALGTGSIYLNLIGREAHGSVPAADANALAHTIGKELLAVKDGAVPVVLATYLGDDVYQGQARSDAPDVRVALAKGYRASWATSLGGAPPELFEDNTKKWSGDHASARPEDVPAFLGTNKKLSKPDPAIADIAATVYKFVGVKPPVGVVGRPMF